MKKINQQIVSKKDGDCTRACVASLLELPIDAVPNFIRFKGQWFILFHHFLKFCGYDFRGTGFPLSNEYPNGDKLKDSPNVNGYVIASVPSENFKNIGHSVIMNLQGKIIHDPSPHKQWQNINALKNKKLQHWMMISKI